MGEGAGCATLFLELLQVIAHLESRVQLGFHTEIPEPTTVRGHPPLWIYGLGASESPKLWFLTVVPSLRACVRAIG